MATIEQVIRAVAPQASDAFVQASIACDAGAIIAASGLTTTRAQAQLIGHTAVECQHFTRFDENLSYSAARLTQVWPRRFPNLAAAAPCAHNPKALAAKVYAGRMGNLSAEDAWNFRGSGALQHTGRDEFARIDKRTEAGVVIHPDALREAGNAKLMWQAACSYFADRNAIGPASAGDTKTVTLRVNGGLNGFSDRETCVARAMVALGGRPIATAGAPALKPLPQDSDTNEKAARKTAHETNEDQKSQLRKIGTGTIAGGAATGAGVKSGGAEWLIVAVVLISAAIIGLVLFRLSLTRKNAATAIIETQQLGQVMQHIGDPPVTAR